MGEITVFLGITSSDVYSSAFSVGMVFLAAVGVILTPIYLLNLLRKVFYGTSAQTMCDVSANNQSDEETVCFGTDCLLPTQTVYSDAKPRELFIAGCFLVLIIGMGLYPKVVMQMYDVTTVAVNAQVRQSLMTFSHTGPNVYAGDLQTFN